MDTFELLRLAIIVGGVLAVWAIVFWIGGACLTGWVAGRQNRDPVAWFFLGLVLSPPVALTALAALPPLELEEEARLRSTGPAGPALPAAATLRRARAA
jgi:hypothetical protein